jgi:hypothetical protein
MSLLTGGTSRTPPQERSETYWYLGWVSIYPYLLGVLAWRRDVTTGCHFTNRRPQKVLINVGGIHANKSCSFGADNYLYHTVRRNIKFPHNLVKKNFWLICRSVVSLWKGQIIVRYFELNNFSKQVQRSLKSYIFSFRANKIDYVPLNIL